MINPIGSGLFSGAIRGEVVSHIISASIGNAGIGVGDGDGDGDRDGIVDITGIMVVACLNGVG